MCVCVYLPYGLRLVVTGVMCEVGDRLSDILGLAAQSATKSPLLGAANVE